MDEALKAALAVRRKLVKQHPGGVNSFATVLDNGKVEDYIGHACMAALRGVDAPKDRKFRYVVVWAPPPPELKDSQLNLIEWVVNRSVWADAFVIKDAEEIRKLGTVLDCEAGPARYIIQANTLIRYLSEFPQWVETWVPLSYYMPPDAACVFADKLKPNDKSYNVQHSAIYNPNHSFLSNSCCTQLALTRILNRDKRDFATEKPASAYITTSRLTQIWDQNFMKCGTEEERRYDYCSKDNLDFDVDGVIRSEVRGRETRRLNYSDIATWAPALVAKNYLGEDV